jgi:predicted ATPase/DNA-binding XRE family transcriptional regulator
VVDGPATGQTGLRFGGLLRQLRDQAGLTQDELAEAAGVSQRAISDLERGINATARKDTAVLLASALALDGHTCELFVAAARGRGPVEAVLSARQGGGLGAFAAATGLVLHNLPARLTSFVGRERELAAVGGLVGEARLVTLTGPGGVGKTRLAVEFAATAAGDFRDGVRLADLAGIGDADLVASLVMQALGVRQSAEVAVIDALRYRLRPAELLLVLDNCEHLLGACAELAETLLGSAPGLRVLATSREPLGVPGEAVYPVPPLAVPAARSDAQGLAGAPAVRLFLARSRSVGAGQEAAPVAVVARICQELDGLPLAIELAAARTSVLSVQEIEAHLADKFRFLGWRRPVADPRHQTLKAAIGWSYGLLSQRERRVLGELSVFAGGFTLATMAAVCCDGDQAAALDLVDRLAAKSLVVAEPAAAGTRYRLLETIRHYAAERLAEAAEAENARRRHAVTFLSLAERERELSVLAREHDNFRAALEWSLSADDETGPRLAAALGSFWMARGFHLEGRVWLERALTHGPAAAPLLANLHRLLGELISQTGDSHRARSILTEGLHVAEKSGLAGLQARLRCDLALVGVRQGASAREALNGCVAAVAMLEADGDLGGAAQAWALAGEMHYYLGESPDDEQALERAVAYARRSGERHLELESIMFLAITLRTLRTPVGVAIARVEQLIEQVASEQWAEAEMLQQLACLYAYAGRFGEARAARARGRSMLTRFGAQRTLAVVSIHSSMIELIAEDPIAAEAELRKGYEMLGLMGDNRYRSTVASLLGRALYAQGRLDEAQQVTEEAAALAPPGDVEPQSRWRSTKAKLLARHGQFHLARRLADEAVALVPPASRAALLGEALVAKAEVLRIAGATAESADSLRAALRIYQDRQAVPLAEQTRASLARLGVNA